MKTHLVEEGCLASNDANDEWERYRRAQAERWLKHVMALGRRVRALQDEIECQRDMAAGLKGVDYDGMPKASGSSADAMPNAVIKLQGLIAEYCAELDGYVLEQREAHEALSALDDGATREALTRHYLLGRPWEQCCVEMGYTYDGMMKLRRRALSCAYDVMPFRRRDPMHPAI